MIRYFRALTVFLLSVAIVPAMAQSTATTSSPYSKYGLGLIDPILLPQNVAMGGIGTATNNINGYNNINPLNPSSYANIRFTAIDAGLYSNFVSFSKSGVPNQTSSNFRFSHVTFAMPVTQHSALSFGLMPYSELGYKYKQTLNRGYGTSSPADTNLTNNVYSGEGGLSKFYLGYGINVTKALTIGANASYIFGKLKQYSSTEYPQLYGVFNSRQEISNSIGGLNYDFGAQYTVTLAEDRHLVFGYSGSASTKLNTESTFLVSQYQIDASTGDEDVARDTTVNRKTPNGKIQLPMIHHFGVSYQLDRKFLVGADYSMGNWSKLSINGVNQGLQNSQSFNIGGQFNPNSNSLHSYWALVDYRFGAHFEKTYVTINNQDIKQMGVTFGLGLPLAANGSSFYKVNIAGDLGRRGTMSNGLIRETYFNLHLSFTLNDKWFQKYKFD
ncbi:hypothetical protein HQ865_00245 [Mucilaginibacter mali]|uniref:Long-subunit fatty acid transport protein n=1 Tax=Mucilaginibacter mali TaxID=2740462 RepID=A0A7D4QCJ5_9SPHI|nr:hypothetical protein [Mucilaginibacter mali]QKJ28252.1 hypothetical protein HQ865_00245 [Mucilaginibacter mali]